MEQSQLILRTAEVSEKSMLGLRTFPDDVVPQAADKQLTEYELTGMYYWTSTATFGLAFVAMTPGDTWKKKKAWTG